MIELVLYVVHNYRALEMKSLELATTSQEVMIILKRYKRNMNLINKSIMTGEWKGLE